MTNFTHRVKSYEWLPLDKVIIVGSGILDQLGLRIANDVDVITDSETFKRLKNKSVLTLETHGDHKVLAGDEIEIWTDWREVDGELWDYGYLSQFTTTIDGVRFVDPHKVLQWKRAMGRIKDEKDIKLLEEYLHERAS